MSEYDNNEEKERQPDVGDVGSNVMNLAKKINDRHKGDEPNEDGASSDYGEGSNKGSENGSSENSDNNFGENSSGNTSDNNSIENNDKSNGNLPAENNSKPDSGNSQGSGSGTNDNSGIIGKHSATGGEQTADTISSNAQNAATTAAETGKDVGEAAAESAASVAEAAAEGAVEGSVVPGAGTVAVAAAKVVWSLKDYIVRILAVLLVILLLPISALENLGSAIWTEDYNEDGTTVAKYTSVKDIYNELSSVVQNEVNRQYQNAVKEALRIASKSKYADYPEFNELILPTTGSKLKNYTEIIRDNKDYDYKDYDYSTLTYPLSVDVCKIIATYTVKCQYEGKEPSKEDLIKCLKKADLFDVTSLEMRKFYYTTYKQLDFETLKSMFPYYERKNGNWEENPTYELVGFELGQILYSEYSNGRVTLSDNERLFGGDIDGWTTGITSSSDGIDYSYAYIKTPYYIEDGKKIASNNGEKSIEYVEVQNYEQALSNGIYRLLNEDIYEVGFHYDPANLKAGGINDENEIYLPSFDTKNYLGNGTTKYATKRLYFNNSDETGDFVKETNLGHDCVRVTVSDLNETALLNSVSGKNTDWKQEQFPLIADFALSSDSKSIELKTNYTPETFTCAMAITSYESNIRSEVFENSDILRVLDDIVTYTYKSKNGKDVIVYMCTDTECKTPILIGKTNEQGVTTFVTEKGTYYFAEIVDGIRTVMKEGDYTLTIKSTRPVSTQGFISPLQLEYTTDKVEITSFYGYRVAPTDGASTNHGGIDIVLLDENGNTKTENCPVYAAKGGTVIEADKNDGYGWYIIIDNEDGITTLYAHLNEVKCSKGEEVKRGQEIALAGNTGVSTGPHLHFEVRVNGEKQNPLNYLPLNNITS